MIRSQGESKPSRMFFLLVVGVLLLATYLRLDQLNEYPPGLSMDESLNTVDAFVVSQTGKLPLYEDFNRPEHLHRVILALGARLFGTQVWAFRFTNVLIGILTVAAAYWAAGQCVADQPGIVRGLAGLAAAGVLAVSMSHVVLSRSLYRGDLLPLCVLLFVGLALRGLDNHKRRDLVLAGGSLALAMHSYTVGLFMPLGLAGLLVVRPQQWRDRLSHLLWIAVGLVVIAAPIFWMLVTDQNRVLARAGDVANESPLDALLDRFDRAWQQLTERGDINSQYNADYAPVVPSMWQWAFMLGLVALVVRLRRPASPLLMVLLVAGLAPVALADEIPHGLRIVGMHAVYPLVIGSGVAFVMALLRMVSVPRLRRIGGLLVGSAILIGIVLQARETYRAYGSWWDNNDHPWEIYGRALPHGEWFFRGDHRALGQWLDSQQTPLLVPADVLNTPTVRTWLLDAYPQVTVESDDVVLPPDTQIVLPWSLELGDIGRDARQFGLLRDGRIAILPPLTAAAHADLVDLIDAGQSSVVSRANGDPLVQVMGLPANWTAETMSREETGDVPLVQFAGGMQIAAWRGPDTLPVVGAEAFTVGLDWELTSSVNHFYSAFVQIQTEDYEVVARAEGELWRWLYPPPLWKTGLPVPTPYTFQIPAELEPGPYRISVGLYLGPYPDTQRHVTASVWGETHDMATVAWLKVPQTPSPLADVRPVDAVVANLFALTGAQAVQIADDTVQITLVWEALAHRPAVDATVFVHALDSDGSLVSQSDIRPAYPTFIWDEGEQVQTVHLLAVDATQDLSLVVGMYTFPEATRLQALQDGEPAPDNLIALGSLTHILE